MKNKYLLGLLSIILICGLGYAGFKIKKRCNLTEYYVSRFKTVFGQDLRSVFMPAEICEMLEILENQMREDGYSRAEVADACSKGSKKAIAHHQLYHNPIDKQ
jgi:hypothetical protein